MDLSSANIRRRAAELGGFLKIHWLALMVVLLAAAFLIVQLQRWFDRLAVERQSEKIEQYDAERQRSQEQTQALQNIFDNQHQSTLKILDAMNAMSGTITKLTENDLRQDRAVSDLKEEYNNARNPGKETKTNFDGRAARRRALPLGEREAGALAADRELYPAAAGANAGNGSGAPAPSN